MVQFSILLQDLRLGVRQIRRARFLNLAMILILALGIGVNSVVFSLVNGLLFRANSRDPASFVRLYVQRSGPSRPVRDEGVPTMIERAAARIGGRRGRASLGEGQELSEVQRRSAVMTIFSSSPTSSGSSDAPLRPPFALSRNAIRSM